MGLDRDLGFSRGHPSGTPDLNDDDEEDDDEEEDDDINENKKEEDDNDKKIFFSKVSNVIPFWNHNLGLI